MAGLVILAAFVAWECARSHPMLNLRYFRNRGFSGAIVSVGLVMFGLFGALFVLTQFLQFQLGYTALQAGVRTLPAAGAIVVVAPLSSVLVRRLGTKLDGGSRHAGGRRRAVADLRRLGHHDLRRRGARHDHARAWARAWSSQRRLDR